MKVSALINTLLCSAFFISSSPVFSLNFDNMTPIELTVTATVTAETCTAVIDGVKDHYVMGEVHLQDIPKEVGQGYLLPNFDLDISFQCKDNAKLANISFATINEVIDSPNGGGKKLFNATQNNTVSLGFDLFNSVASRRFSATPGHIYSWNLDNGTGSIKFMDVRIYKNPENIMAAPGNAHWDFTFLIWNP